MKISSRAASVRPFQVMQLLARARELEAEGRDIVHMEIGEPDFPTPPAIVEAALAYTRRGDIRYTSAAGSPALRHAITQWYQRRYAVTLDPRRVIITPGASGALQIALLLISDPGDRVMLSDPGYPCYANLALALGCLPYTVPLSSETNFRLTAQTTSAHWRADTKAILVASPSNPCGTGMDLAALTDLSHFVESVESSLICDEIYQGLEYGAAPLPSILNVTPNAFVVNSFSKYFGMTGWRLGWLVIPEGYIDAADGLAQNLFISASAIAQAAALAAFSDATLCELERRRRIFLARRDFLLAKLPALGFQPVTSPEGAFYLYARCDRFALSSDSLSRRLLEEAGVAITPGGDFGIWGAQNHVRFAFTSELDRLKTGLNRIAEWLNTNPQIARM